MNGKPQARWSRWGRKRDGDQAALASAGVRAYEPAVVLKAFKPSVPHLQVRNFVRNVAAPSGALRVITGLAIPYNVPTEDLGGFREVYKPGAFWESIGSDDVRALVNGNIDRLLGRVSAGTLSLSETRGGVRVEIDAPETSYGDDVLTSIRRGDISDMTAAFYVLEHRNEYDDAGGVLRVVTKAKLLAVSVSAFSLFVGAVCDTEKQIAAAYERGVKAGKQAAGGDFEAGRAIGAAQVRASRGIAANAAQARISAAIQRRFDHHA